METIYQRQASQVGFLSSYEGLMYDFEICAGKGTCEDVRLEFSCNILMALTSELSEYQNFVAYFDNWFSSLQIAITLK